MQVWQVMGTVAPQTAFLPGVKKDFKYIYIIIF